MLVLTRKPGQSIMIDGGITITILSKSSSQVKVGIDAPREINIYREELK